jgi:nitroreductase
VRRDLLADPKFNIFYNAGTLVVIYCRPSLQWAPIDCALAAENLMLAAYAMGLGTCPIGFAQSWLDDAEVKRELRVPGDLTAILPIIVGYPTKAPPKISRHKPEITFCS